MEKNEEAEPYESDRLFREITNVPTDGWLTRAHKTISSYGANEKRCPKMWANATLADENLLKTFNI